MNLGAVFLAIHTELISAERAHRKSNIPTCLEFSCSVDGRVFVTTNSFSQVVCRLPPSSPQSVYVWSDRCGAPVSGAVSRMRVHSEGRGAVALPHTTTTGAPAFRRALRPASIALVSARPDTQRSSKCGTFGSKRRAWALSSRLGAP